MRCRRLALGIEGIRRLEPTTSSREAHRLVHAASPRFTGWPLFQQGEAQNRLRGNRREAFRWGREQSGMPMPQESASGYEFRFVSNGTSERDKRRSARLRIRLGLVGRHKRAPAFCELADKLRKLIVAETNLKREGSGILRRPRVRGPPRKILQQQSSTSVEFATVDNPDVTDLGRKKHRGSIQPGGIGGVEGS